MMTKENIKSAAIKGFAEMLRVVALAVIPLLIDAINKGEIDWRFVGGVAAIAALRFIDKVLHTLGKETDNHTLVKGITRF